jgi:ATP phosphoribosyltransferase regulatory subunit
LDGLAALEQTWDLIEAAGAAERVVVDFSVMSSFDYYTGLVLEAYAPGVGLPLGSGGRYDKTLEAYGEAAPAAGFAFSLERTMQALLVQGATARAAYDSKAPVVLRLDPVDPAATFKQTAELRAAGIAALVQAGKEKDGD